MTARGETQPEYKQHTGSTCTLQKMSKQPADLSFECPETVTFVGEIKTKTQSDEFLLGFTRCVIFFPSHNDPA